MVLLTCGYSEEAALKSRCVEINLHLLENDIEKTQQREDCLLKTGNETTLIQNCDCSDPKNYDYGDEGRFRNYIRLYALYSAK